MVEMEKANGGPIEKGFLSYLPIVFACVCLCGIPSAMLVSTAGIFYPVISADLGVQTAEISMWMSMMLLACAIISPVMGRWFQKYDIRAILIISVIVESAVFLLFSFAQAPWMFWVGGFISGITNTALLGLATPTLLNRYFKVHVGLLTGICTAFTGFGGMLFIAIGQSIIDTSGWRLAYLVYAAVAVVVLIPVILLCVKNQPADRGLLPYGTAKAIEREGSAEAVENPTSVDPSVAIRHPLFWMLVVFGFCVNLACQIAAFFPQYVNWYNGLPDVSSGLIAAAFVSGAGLASVAQAGNAVGKIGLGFFTDISVRVATVVLSLCGAAGIMCVWLAPTTFLLPVGGFIFGFFIAGVLVLCPMFVRRVFGTGKNYPVFFGRISVSVTLGGAAGNLLWPLLADNMGGFGTVFGVALVVIAAVLVLGIAIYRMRDVLPREA